MLEHEPWSVKPPAGRDGLVLYLDFDGVLHHENVLWHPKRGAYIKAPEGYTLFQHAELLEHSLEPYPLVQIVLSTSWVLQYGVLDSTRRLPKSLQKRVIGATFHSRYMNKESFQSKARGQQVIEDVMRRCPRDWIALDDNVEGWPETDIHHFVQTHEYEGLSDPVVLAKFRLRLQQLGMA